MSDELAAQAHTRHIPVLIATGTEHALDHRDVACVLKKPVLSDDLVDAVRKCLASGARPAGP